MRKKSATKIIAAAAITLDGKIALHRRHFSSWTSREDKRFLHSFLDTCDVVVVGRQTYETARKPLSKRNCIVLTHSVAALKKRSDNLVFLNPKGADLRAILRSHKKVAVLGGCLVYTYFLKHNLLDELFLTIEPLVFGRGIPLFAGSSKLPKHFRLLSMKRLNKKGSVLLRYKRV